MAIFHSYVSHYQRYTCCTECIGATSFVSAFVVTWRKPMGSRWLQASKLQHTASDAINLGEPLKPWLSDNSSMVTLSSLISSQVQVLCLLPDLRCEMDLNTSYQSQTWLKITEIYLSPFGPLLWKWFLRMGPPSWPVELGQATRSTPPKATAQKKRNPPEQFGAFGARGGPPDGINLHKFQTPWGWNGGRYRIFNKQWEISGLSMTIWLYYM